MYQTKLVRSVILEHLQGNLDIVGEDQEKLQKTIKTLQKIWDISDDEIEKSKANIGTLKECIASLDGITALSRQLCYMGSQDIEEENISSAITNVERAKLLDPQEAAIFYNSATINYKAGFYEYCISDCLKAIQCDPTHLNSYIRLGLTCWILNRPKEALKAYNEGLNLSPGNPIILHNIEVLNSKNSIKPTPLLDADEKSRFNSKYPDLRDIRQIHNDESEQEETEKPTLFSGWQTSEEFAEQINSPEVMELLKGVDVDEIFDILSNSPEDLKKYLEDERMRKLISAITGV